ncbi:DUF4835 domain-containing protein [Dokdonia sp. Dokd-P16]|uniref:type IX secretion system protein PorD n=1 Tax=Dokdonia sp. Dokd-P16 TaxID=2173169 RepID=UPI000D543170|nr:DUF4835 family protein [Dokdonia sp. Dokd-P16]AWH74472.1 DUF4835 domain-containing protein [Dokdonia sp. Dokd-P16]
MRIFTLLIVLLFSFNSIAQELNAVVVINAEQTNKADLQVFKTLERSLTEFVNNTKWTDRRFKQQERIDCSFNIIITQQDGNNFRATVQVGASRPVYGSNYDTATFNFNDKQFDFEYTEFQPLIYNPNTFDSNLVSVMAFYAYTIIGMDANTFKLNDGDKYFQEAKQIVTTAQPNNQTGWNPQDGSQSRYRLNEDLLSPNFREFAGIMYSYHRTGLDFMVDDKKRSKQTISTTLSQFQSLYKKRPNNFLTRVFFDTKAEEIASIFSSGPSVNITSLVEVLNQVAPTKSNFWRQIKF